MYEVIQGSIIGYMGLSRGILGRQTITDMGSIADMEAGII